MSVYTSDDSLPSRRFGEKQSAQRQLVLPIALAYLIKILLLSFCPSTYT